MVTHGPLLHAIAPNSLVDGGPVTDPESYMTPFGIESGLCDALFLAEKNVLYPDAGQIAVLDDYLTKFLEAKVLNPGDGSLGSLLPNPEAVAVGHGRASLYMLAFSLYAAMVRIADGYGATHSAEGYIHKAVEVAKGLEEHIDMRHYVSLPLLGEVASARSFWQERKSVDALDPFSPSSQGESLSSLFVARFMSQARRRHPF